MKKIIKEILQRIMQIISIALYPIIDLFTDITSNSYMLKKLSNKLAKFIKETSTFTIKYTLIVYYIILTIYELCFLAVIIKGEIPCIAISELAAWSFVIITYNIFFVFFLNKHYKTNKFSYIIYFQILFFAPIMIVYWIANIEEHNIYLSDLNATQWLSAFNTIILYLSACFIGLISLYKSEKNEIGREKINK